MTDLSRAINEAREAWNKRNGECSMCSAGDVPELGFHRRQYPCGKMTASALPGEMPSPVFKSISQLVNGSERVTIIAFRGAQMVGIADIARRVEDEEPVLGNLYVLEGKRRKGLGRALVTEAKQWAWNNRTTLWLRSDPGVLIRQWHASNGFKETGERDDCGKVWMKLEG